MTEVIEGGSSPTDAERLRDRSLLPPPAEPGATPRYLGVSRVLIVGSMVSLVLFAAVYAVLWKHTAMTRHWLPWVVLAGSFTVTFYAASGLLTTLGHTIRHEDIARLRRRELTAHRDRAREVLSRVRDAVVVTDPDGYVLEWNDAAVRTIGGSMCGPPVGRHCTDVLGIRSVDRPLDCHDGCALLQLAGDEGGAVGIEVLRELQDGRVQPLLVNVGAVRTDDDEIVEVVHSLRDITRLREADDAKTMFLATTSHELRTPLAVIRGFAEMLAHRDVDEATRATALSTILQRVEELTDMVDGLLQTSRLERGGIQLQARLVDVAPILRDRIDDFRATTDRDIRSVGGHGPLVAWADRAALGTVIDHLLENAIKYSPEGGPVTVHASRDEQDRVVLHVTDEGVGMDAEAAAHCFDRFWQAEQGDDRRFGGTGVGLYLVRSLVEGMHGRVSVVSDPGRGSRFTVSLRTGPPAERESRRVRDRSRGSLVDDVLRHTGVGALSGERTGVGGGVDHEGPSPH